MEAETFDSHILRVKKAINCAPTVEERAALTTSLLVLKKNYKFDTVRFIGMFMYELDELITPFLPIGKVFGVSGDYLLVQGYENADVFKRKSFCRCVYVAIMATNDHRSSDGAKWVQLPVPSDETITFCAKIHGRFSGVLSTAYSVVVDEEEEEETDSSSVLSGKKVSVTEEQRLAAAITALDHDTAAVPRGAYRLSAAGEVVYNTGFAGLDVDTATELESYVHLRKPEIASKRTLLEQENVDKFLDFMDPITHDLPKGITYLPKNSCRIPGCWSIQKDGVSGMIVLRSLKWPGFVGYHIPSTSQFGYAYYGTGECNEDIVFQL